MLEVSCSYFGTIMAWKELDIFLQYFSILQNFTLF